MLTFTQVKKIANLARLTLSQQEIKKFQKHLTEVLKYIEQLKKVNTKGIEPTSQVTGLENVFQEDKVCPSLSYHKDFFKVKAVLEK